MSNAAGSAWSFTRPPVVEVALAVETFPLAELGALGLARVVDGWVDEFPVVQETMATPPSPLSSAEASFQLPLGFGFPGVRFILSEEEPESAYLLQIQNDRLILNWRRTGEAAEYPRFPSLQRRFTSFWSQLLERVPESAVQPVIVEVTYVNLVEATSEAPSAAAFAVVDPDGLERAGSKAIRFQQSRSVTGAPGEVTGTTVLTVEPRDPHGDEHLFTVSTRLSVAAASPSVTVDASLSRAHDIAVEAFGQSTRARHHRQWGLEPR